MLKDEHCQEGLDDSIEIANQAHIEVWQFNLAIVLHLLILFEGGFNIEFEA